MARKGTNKGDEHFVHVFVYGSLKKDLGNHKIYMERLNAEFIGYDSISGPFSMVSLGGFPAVCHNDKIKGAPEVFGELYKLPAEALKSLDALEGHPRWYCRERLSTDIHDRRAWIYLMPQEAMKGRSIVPRNMWQIKEEEREFWDKKEVSFPK
jgi:gamma-glutamylcyclotransferase (GGCT)/AIG2-like uncharacterized protein YtfP